jgi:hypothetical protein
MRLGTIGTHRLTDLHLGEFADQPGTRQQTDAQRGERGQHRAQRDVVEDREEPEVLREPLRQFEQHQ